MDELCEPRLGFKDYNAGGGGDAGVKRMRPSDLAGSCPRRSIRSTICGPPPSQVPDYGPEHGLLKEGDKERAREAACLTDTQHVRASNCQLGVDSPTGAQHEAPVVQFIFPAE